MNTRWPESYIRWACAAIARMSIFPNGSLSVGDVQSVVKITRIPAGGSCLLILISFRVTCGRSGLPGKRAFDLQSGDHQCQKGDGKTDAPARAPSQAQLDFQKV